MWLCESRGLNTANRIPPLQFLFQPSFQTGRWKDQGGDETQEGKGETKRCGIFLCWFSIECRLGSKKASGWGKIWILFSSLPYSLFSSSLLQWTRLLQPSTICISACILVLLLITLFFPAVFQFYNIKTINQPGNHANNHQATYHTTSNLKCICNIWPANKYTNFLDTSKTTALSTS